MAGKMAQQLRVFVTLLDWILASMWRLTAVTLVPDDPTPSVYAEYQVHTGIHTHVYIHTRAKHSYT